jgi:Subtilase family
MSMSEGDGEQKLGQPRWSDRIAVSQLGNGFAYVPRELLIRGEATLRRAQELIGSEIEEEEIAEDSSARLRLTEAIDPLAVIEVMRSEGFDAQPNHVFFAHGCSPCEQGPHPSVQLAGPGGVGANPWRSNPWRSNPWRSNPWRSNEAPTSTAFPERGPSLPQRPELEGPGRLPRIVVLDTGLAAAPQRPPLLDPPASGATPRITGDPDLPDAAIALADGSSSGPDGYLDPVAGHGTFIAGLIEQLAKGCTIRVEHVVSPMGDGNEWDIAQKLKAEVALTVDRADIISMSFGGQVLDQPAVMRDAVAAARLAGIVLVASAGNDGVCIPQYPAAFDDVIGVAAVGPAGPPEWTNYGDWVDACAPGVELVSAFFADFNGKFPLMNTVDIDHFVRWACWSGTSFSAPVVVAALAREMVLGGIDDANEAVRRVVTAAHLLRLPCLGTVVNL